MIRGGGGNAGQGHVAPSSSDSGSCGSPLYDFYWGMELYPRLGPLDVKVFTNCRFGMMAWPYLLLCFTAKQYELYGVVADSMIASLVVRFAVWLRACLSSLSPSIRSPLGECQIKAQETLLFSTP